MDSIFHFNFDSDSNHEPNASGDLAIPILIPSHSDSHSYSDFNYKPNAPSQEIVLSLLALSAVSLIAVLSFVLLIIWKSEVLEDVKVCIWLDSKCPFFGSSSKMV